MRFTLARQVKEPRFLVTNEVQHITVTSEDKVSFATWGGTRVESGRVMEVDLLAQLPIRVEYHTSTGDKRIERFHPDEFKTFKKEQ